eukprot:5354015-Amphidinium_carterae.1
MQPLKELISPRIGGTEESEAAMAPAGAAHLNLTLGGLLSVGGVVGYLKAGSIPSLVGGLGCGSLMAAS